MIDDRTGRRLKGPSADVEQAAAQQLRERLAMVEQVIGHHEKIAGSAPPPRSELGVDDRLTSPVQLSHLAGYAISVAVDNLKALIALVRDGDGLMIYQVAQYPLIRSAIEAGALAVGVLGPDDRDERILRLLRARMDELIFDRRLIKRMTIIHPEDTAAERSRTNAVIRSARASRAKTEATLESIAKARGIAPEDYAEGQPGWFELVDQAAQFAFNARNDIGASTWMALGGLTHPSTARGLMFSVVEEFSEPVDGVHITRISGSVQSVSMGVAGALLFLNSAQQLNRQRRLQVDGTKDQLPKT